VVFCKILYNILLGVKHGVERKWGPKN